MADVQYVTLYLADGTPVQVIYGTVLYQIYLASGATLYQPQTPPGSGIPTDPNDPFPQYVTPDELDAALTGVSSVPTNDDDREQYIPARLSNTALQAAFDPAGAAAAAVTPASVTANLPTRLTDTALKAAYESRATPAGITGLAGVFDARRSVYNATSANLRKTRAKAGAALAGTGLWNVACLGDSLTAGFPYRPNTYSWPQRLEKLLTAAGYRAQNGWVYPLSDGNGSAYQDSRWTPGTGFTGTVGGFRGIYNTTSGATATYTSTETGTVVEFLISGVYGAFTYRVDGAAAVSVPAGGVNNTLGAPFTITGLADTAHTLVITSSSTTPIYLYAARVRPAFGALITNAGYGGTKTSDWDTTVATESYQHQQTTFATAQDTAFISLVTNDVYTGTAQATWSAQFSRIVDQVKARGAEPVLWIPPQPGPGVVTDAVWTARRQAVYGIVDAKGVPLIDMTDRWSDFATANGNGLMVDTLHATQGGYADIASAVLALLR